VASNWFGLAMTSSKIARFGSITDRRALAALTGGLAAFGARARQLQRSVISVSYRCVSPRLSRPDNSPGGRQRLMTTSRGMYCPASTGFPRSRVP
jgi:hypothetical protein